jgi:hypothetical protein
VPNLAQDPVQREYVRTLYSLTKTLDPTRPVIGNDGWEYLVGDMVGIHDYAFDAEDIRERYGSAEALQRTAREVRPFYRSITLERGELTNKPVLLTECGGISYRPAAGNRWFGYATVTTREDFLAKYSDLMHAILDCPPLAGFCYTQLTDTGHETNGLLSDQREPKLDPKSVRMVTSRHSASIPGDMMRAIQDAQGVSPFSSPSVESGQ